MDYDQDLVELAEDPELVVPVEFCGQGACQAYLGDKAHGYIRIQKPPSLRHLLSVSVRCTEHQRLHPAASATGGFDLARAVRL